MTERAGERAARLVGRIFAGLAWAYGILCALILLGGLVMYLSMRSDAGGMAMIFPLIGGHLLAQPWSGLLLRWGPLVGGDTGPGWLMAILAGMVLNLAILVLLARFTRVRSNGQHP